MQLEHLRHHHSDRSEDFGHEATWQSEGQAGYRGERVRESAMVEKDLHRQHVLLPEEPNGIASANYRLSSAQISLPSATFANLQEEALKQNTDSATAEAAAARYPKPNARQSWRNPNSQDTAPWHAFWKQAPGGIVVGEGASLSTTTGDEEDGWSSRKELLQRQQHQQHQQLLWEKEDAELSRRRRLEMLQTHFKLGKDSGRSTPVRSTFGDAYGRDDAVLQIRNVYDARRFLEADASSRSLKAPATHRLPAASAWSASARTELKRSSCLPVEPSDRVMHRTEPSVYKKDFITDQYPRPYIQPPLRDSGLLPKISDAYKMESVSHNFHFAEPPVENGKLFSSNQHPATAGPAAIVTGSFRFIGGPHLPKRRAAKANQSNGFEFGPPSMYQEFRYSTLLGAAGGPAAGPDLGATRSAYIEELEIL